MASSDVSSISNYKFVDGQETIGIGIAIPLICILVVALRFLTRVLQRAHIGIDDWLSAASLFTIVGMGACLIAGAAKKVMGYPTPAPPPGLTGSRLLEYIDPTSLIAEKIEFPFQILMMTGYALIKLSALTFYDRVFSPNKRSSFSLICRGTTAAVLVWYTIFIIMIIWGCGGSVWKNWGNPDARTHCPISLTSKHIGLMISDLLLDVWIICLPIYTIWQLHLPVRQRLGVIGVMLLGATAVAASIARVVVYVKLLAAFPATIGVDTNQAITVQLYWCLLEAGLALIAVCLPSVHGLFKTAYAKSLVNKVRISLGLRLSDVDQGSVNCATQRSTRSRPANGEYIDLEAVTSTNSQKHNSAKSAYSVDTEECTMESLDSSKEQRY